MRKLCIVRELGQSSICPQTWQMEVEAQRTGTDIAFTWTRRLCTPSWTDAPAFPSSSHTAKPTSTSSTAAGLPIERPEDKEELAREWVEYQAKHPGEDDLDLLRERWYYEEDTSPVDDDREEPVEGCRMYDLGWMKMRVWEAVPGFYYGQPDRMWNHNYVRPPDVGSRL